jgi:membrane-bound ClpP family serine protease
VKKSRQEVAEAYQLAPSSLRGDPLEGRDPVVVKIEAKGPVTGALRERLLRRIGTARGQRANVVILQIECAGGDLVAAREIADELRAMQQADGELGPVQFIAYIPDEAPDYATFIALGCSEIVMRRMKPEEREERQRDGKKDRLLGDFSVLVDDPSRAADAESARRSLREVAEAQGYPPLLIDALFDKDLVVHRVRGRIDATKRKLMTEEELAEDRRGAKEWISEAEIKHKGELLQLTPTLAEELGLVRFTIDNRNIAELYDKYGIDPARVKEAGPDWLDALAEFLRRSEVMVVLILVAVLGLILELKVPGLAVPGIISALCFVLFFWSQAQDSELTLLAVLLFILGVLLIGVEIFLLPGFGVTGISGILLVIGGLGLATMNKLPQSSQDWSTFGMNMMQFALAMIGGTIAALFVARYLPNIPYANRLMLRAPADAPEADEPILPGAAQAAALLGAIGVATTVLRPAGMARFGDEFADVVSEGEYIEPGTRVQVVEVEGTRIVVKAV